MWVVCCQGQRPVPRQESSVWWSVSHWKGFILKHTTPRTNAQTQPTRVLSISSLGCENKRVKGLWKAALRTCSCGHSKNPQQELGPHHYFFPQGQFWIKIFFWIYNQTFSSGLGARFDPWFSDMCIWYLSFQTYINLKSNLGKCKSQFKRIIWAIMPTCIGNLLKKSNIGSFPALISAVNTSFSQTANSWEH